MIYKFYKKEGETMGKMLANFKSQYNIPETEKVTYSGRLDPLACGEVLILTGEDVHKKDDFNKHDKVYKFTAMFGVSTDTGDILGIPKKESFFKKLFRPSIKSINEHKIKRIAKSLIGSYYQKYPAYSSYNINGIPMWKLSRDGQLPKKIPRKKITVYKIEIFKVYLKSGEDVLKEVKAKVNSVDGDFRQGWINQGWGDLLPKSSETIFSEIESVTGMHLNKYEKFVFVDMRATVSSGTYIRTLCGDMGKKANIPALAYSIEREEIL